MIKYLSIGAFVFLTFDADAIITKIIPPVGCSVSPIGFNIFKNTEKDIFTTDLDMDSYIHKPDNTYYVAITGSDKAGDGSKGSPWRSLSKAAESARLLGSVVTTIFVSPGVYHRDYTFKTSIGVNYPIFNVICPESEPALITTAHECEFLLHGGNCYKATVDGVIFAVVDLAGLDPNGVPTRLTKVKSIDECVATSGSFFKQGKDIYVNKMNPSEPPNDTNVLLLDINYNARFSGSGWFARNVHFYGGTQAIEVNLADAESMFVFDKCVFHTSWQKNAFSCSSLNRGKQLLLKDCRASYGYNDGFNYHAGRSGGVVFEIDCQSSSNGINSSLNNQNGSTVHDGISIIRVNPLHVLVRNRAVHDIGPGHSWNLGGSAGDVTAKSPKTDSVAWLCGLPKGDTTKMWLDTCDSRGGCAIDFGVYKGCEFYTRNCRTSGIGKLIHEGLFIEY